ncbi:MAG: NAD/NADP octopine/nopaline dehydrogenase family protein [Pseudomonadota bacterium]|nr:NAD/NADP octopine/nopaline dehydrogenase family protein [Pseudomonadota bacterium]
MGTKRVAILGAGHGGLAAAADLTARGFEVSLHARRQETLSPLQNQGGVLAQGVQDGLFPIDLLTTNLEEAITGVDLIMLVLPSVAHKFYAEGLASLLNPDIPIFVNPGHTGGALHFVNELRRSGYVLPIKTCETVTLTYICRKSSLKAVDIFSYTRKLKFAAFPGKYAKEMYNLIKPIYPEISLVSSVLETALTNINAVFHTPAMLLNAGWIEDTKGDFRFYNEGITPAVGRVIGELDAERMKIAGALKVPTASFLENFYQAGLTTKAAFESGDIAKACVDSKPNKEIKSPSSLDHRYVHEDVGYGLVPFAEFGRLAGVRTPTIDALVHIFSELMTTSFSKEGLTLSGMGLENLDPRGVHQFVEDGA